MHFRHHVIMYPQRRLSCKHSWHLYRGMTELPQGGTVASPEHGGTSPPWPESMETLPKLEAAGLDGLAGNVVRWGEINRQNGDAREAGRVLSKQA